jgi:nitrogen fixation NifU-like protein
MDELSLELLLDHYKDPRNYGHLEDPDIVHEEGNPACGDQIRIEVKLSRDQKKIEDIRFSGKGCAISQAAASMLTEELKGRPLEDVKHFSKEEMLDLLGIEVSPMRIKCALLALKIVKAGAYGISGWPGENEGEGEGEGEGEKGKL